MAGTPRVGSIIFAASTVHGDVISQDVVNEMHRGVRLNVSVTAGSTAATKPTFKLQGKIPGSTSYYNLWSAQATTAASQTFRVLLYPGASTLGSKSTAAGYTKVINDQLPAIWRFTSTNLGAGTAGLATWSAGADLLT